MLRNISRFFFLSTEKVPSVKVETGSVEKIEFRYKGTEQGHVHACVCACTLRKIYRLFFLINIVCYDMGYMRLVEKNRIPMSGACAMSQARKGRPKHARVGMR